jgi:hypothetical protein
MPCRTAPLHLCVYCARRGVGQVPDARLQPDVRGHRRFGREQVELVGEFLQLCWRRTDRRARNRGARQKGGEKVAPKASAIRMGIGASLPWRHLASGGAEGQASRA